ncbi:MAG: PilZ domain-containing protein [Treponema sp.]|jgi:hypothetical protein|nr:PilZ domain-containing protein [Treponema sp.]
MDTNQNFSGKKTFFLYPQVIVYNEVITDLFIQEYEAYVVRDHPALRKILKRFPDSIVFVNIDERLKEKEWEAWIRGVMSDPFTEQVSVGVLTTGRDDGIRHKYLYQVRITSGFIHVSTDLKRLTSQITEKLQINDALGRRKFIRTTTHDERMTTVNIPIAGRFVTGSILDISSAGFSCIFQEDPFLEKNSLIPNIQIKLKSVLMRAEGIVFGSRIEDFMKVYVFVFTPRTDSNTRAKIRAYIRMNIQDRMDMELKK